MARLRDAIWEMKHSNDMHVQPFTINVPQATLDDLQERLAETRWADEVEGVGWDYGTNHSYLKSLVDYWHNRFDWRAQEAKLNQFAQFRAEIDGVGIHFIHERGKGPNPTPILLTHGWPDSFYRMVKIIPMLTDPARYGGDPAHSFDVIVPSIPGFGFSDRPRGRGMNTEKIADLWAKLMAGLGYEQFAAAGGDMGSEVTMYLAHRHPDKLIGIHLTDLGYHVAQGQPSELSEAETVYLQALEWKGYQEGAYAMLLGTKPQTFTVGLNDSPVGWASLVIEKFRTWSDCDGDVEARYTKDDLLTNIMLHWIEGIDPRGYREEWVSPSLEPNQQVNVPVGLALPPKDLDPVPPREFAERNLKNLQRYTVLEHGGHFAALEFPELMAEEMRTFFRPLRKQTTF